MIEEIGVQTAVGIAAAPGIVASVVQVFRPLLSRWLPSDALPPLAMVLGVGYVMAAWQGGVIEAENAVVAGLLGLTVGVGASGVHAVVSTYSNTVQRMRGTGNGMGDGTG